MNELLSKPDLSSGYNPRGCIYEAVRLMYENQARGAIYFVHSIPDFGQVIHAYYIPDESDNKAVALNQAENGFGDYPRLTVEQVMKHGDKQDYEAYLRDPHFSPLLNRD